MIPALIVPVLNRPDLLLRMIASIDHPVADLLIIDNGRCLGERPPLPGPPVQRTHVLTMPTNLGVPASWNLGIKALPFAPWWLVVNSDAYFAPGSLAAFADAARADALVLSGGAPPWCAFAIGDAVVEVAGLFDEAFVPAYFEDNDMERRVRYWGLDVVCTNIPVHHDNSSTIGSDPALRARNDATFAANFAHYQAKQYRGDYTAGQWSLSRRRELSWD